MVHVPVGIYKDEEVDKTAGIRTLELTGPLGLLRQFRLFFMANRSDETQKSCYHRPFIKERMGHKKEVLRRR